MLPEKPNKLKLSKNNIFNYFIQISSVQLTVSYLTKKMNYDL